MARRLTIAFSLLLAFGLTFSAVAQTRTYVAYVGSYSGTVAYNLNDMVSSGSEFYISLAPDNLNNAPGSSASMWALVSSGAGIPGPAGPPGPAGATGSAGPAGATGPAGGSLSYPGVTSDGANGVKVIGTVAAGAMAVNNTSATATPVTVNTTTASGSTLPFPAFGAGMIVTKPGILGYSGLSGSCVIAVVGGICYAGSTQAIDAINNAGYTHTVAWNPQVVQNPLRTLSTSAGSDVYGVPTGIYVGPGVWPGSYFRGEGVGGPSTTYGQVATIYDTLDGVAVTALFARPGCRTDPCNSQDIRLQARVGGVLLPYASIYQDILGRIAFDNQPLAINMGISPAGGGVKHARLSGGWVNCNASGLGGLCTNSGYVWPAAFADNSYTLTCSVVAMSGGVVAVTVESKTAAGFTLLSSGLVNTATNTASEVDCIAVHD